LLRVVKERDPFYLQPAWKKLRLAVLRRDRYICQECKAKCLGKKKNGISPQVDHIIPRKECPERAMDMSNLRVLCHPCHSKRTILDTMAKAKPEIGLDGYPLESA